jgi:hypothetical protein
MRRRLCHWLTLACLCAFPVIALGQAGMHQVKVGPYGDQVRIIDALATPAANGYKLQSLIVDIMPAKNKRDQPLAVHVDLTATVRDMQTGKKDQQALVLRWAANGDFEVKCDGKWTKQDATKFATVVDTVKAVISNVPLDQKAPTDVTLPAEVEQRVSNLLESLAASDLPCIRKVN